MKPILIGFLCGIALVLAVRSLATPERPASPPPPATKAAVSSPQTSTAIAAPQKAPKKTVAAPDIPHLEQKLKDAQANSKSAALRASQERPLSPALATLLDEADETNTQLRYQRMRAAEDWYNQNAFAIRELEIQQEDNLPAAIFFASCSSAEPVGTGTIGEATRVAFDADPDLLPRYRKQFADAVRSYLADPILADRIQQQTDLNSLTVMATETLPRLRGKFRSDSAIYGGVWGTAFEQNERYLFLLCLSQSYNKNPTYREAQDRVDEASKELSAAKEGAAP